MEEVKMKKPNKTKQKKPSKVAKGETSHNGSLTVIELFLSSSNNRFCTKQKNHLDGYCGQIFYDTAWYPPIEIEMIYPGIYAWWNNHSSI